MKTHTRLVLLLVVAALTSVSAQQPASKPAPIIFAVLNDGAVVEPIAYLEDKKLEATIDGGQDVPVLARFHKLYFKPKSTYQLIFGGASAGTVTIKSSDLSAECVRHTAQATVASTKTRLKGNVMALATSSSIKAVGSGTRRLPTAAERGEIESLVRAEFGKQKIAASVLRKLKYQNLTAIDVDNDDVVEFVGTYWVEPTLKSRALIFFIAEKNADDKYAFAFSDYKAIDQKDTMSDDITTVDSGVGHELLLDVLDIDGDGAGEIFTYSPSFEGAGFNVYRRGAGKWARIYEEANYRCAF